MSEKTPESKSREPENVFERVLNNPETRHAFYNTTQGLLVGDPESSDVLETIDCLSNAAVAFLFLADDLSTVPEFVDGKHRLVGRDEICRVLGSVASHSARS